MLNTLSKEEQDSLVAVIDQAARGLENLLAATDRALAFYLPKHEEKWSKYQNLRNTLQLSATGKATSVPDYYGVILNTLETDPAQAREAQVRYRQLAKVLHPDHQGSAALFHICTVAYKSRDLHLLDLLNQAIYKKLDLSIVEKSINRRTQAQISVIHASPAYKLLKLDPAAGKHGIIKQALDYSEEILDKLIITLGVSLLNGDKDAV